MKRLQVKTILEYYDVPQILIATDTIGTHYLCVLYDCSDNGDFQFIATQISFTKLASFLNGKEDLRALFVQPLDEDVLYRVSQIGNELLGTPLSSNEISEEMLPLEGYFYVSEKIEEDGIIAETISIGHPIIRVGFEDASNSHTIDATCLSRALGHYQKLLSNCHKKLKGKELDKITELRVTTFQAASFDVHFQVNAPLNLFGSSELDGTLRQLDNLFRAPNDDVFKETVQFLSGHTITSYKNFLEVLMENKLSLKYKWVASITDNEIINVRMSLPKIERIHDLLLESQEVEAEDKTFEGIFLASSVENGKWVFKPNNEKKNINGVSDNNEILSGVVIEQQLYRIICKEVQEQNNVSLKITNKLILNNIEKLNQ